MNDSVPIGTCFGHLPMTVFESILGPAIVGLTVL